MAGTRGRRNARICDNNHLEDASVTTTEDVDFPFLNALNSRQRGRIWKPGVSTVLMEIDLGTAKQCSFFALFGESNKALKISNAAVVTVKANMINLFTGSEPFSQVVPVTDKGIFADLTTNDALTGQQYRFWQIEIDDSTNPEELEISYIYLGDHIDFQFNVQQGFQFQATDLSRRATSDSGTIYSARKNQYNVFSAMGFSYLGASDRIKILNTAQRLGLTTPFVFVLDPQQIGFEFEFGTLLCYWTDEPKYTHAYLNKFNLQFGVREVV